MSGMRRKLHYAMQDALERVPPSHIATNDCLTI